MELRTPDARAEAKDLRERAAHLGDVILRVDPESALPVCPQHASAVTERRILLERNMLLDEITDGRSLLDL